MGCLNSKVFIIDKNESIYKDMIWNSREDCCICLDDKSCVLLLPCNHINICEKCINRNIYFCPICQEQIYSKNFLKIIPIELT